MNLRRIVQLALTGFVGQGVTIVGQLLIPPLFFHFYASGLQVYGEWIALSASINYLGTLNYGVQTYANNQMTILYNRGEVHEAKKVQSSAVRLLLLLILSFVAVGGSVFFIPVAQWLRLRHVSPHAAALTLYLLILQMAFVMILSLLTNSYMVVGKLHRGKYWADGQRLCAVIGLSAALWMCASFPVLAAVQLGSLLLFVLLVLVDVWRVAPILLPSLHYGTWKKTAEILKPSGHFVLIAMAGFLTWQGPILLIQRILGPSAVAVFALVRVVFQMSRQILSIASGMVSQEITLLVGQRNWPSLRRLYDLSERVVLFMIPIMSIGSLLMCPFLFVIWLHKRALYTPLLCILMAIVSAVLGIKEHKTQFQSSSNQHESLSLFILGGYVCMLFVAVFSLRSFGLPGFMLTWIVWEAIQTIYVVHLNDQLFPANLKVSWHPLLKLVIFMGPAFALAAWPANHNQNWTLTVSVAVAIALTTFLATIAYFVFGVGEVRRVIEARVRRLLVSKA